jgi:hypothetical protein
MLISRHTNDYHSIMISLKNSLDLIIDGVISNDIDIYTSSCGGINCLLKSPTEMPKYDDFLIDEFIKFKNNESDSLNDNTVFGIKLSFKNTKTICNFYNNKHTNNNIITIDDINQYIKYCDNQNDNKVVIRNSDTSTMEYSEGYYNNIPLLFKFDYFIGG